MRLPPLVRGVLIRRYKRFLADVALDSGETVTAWCPNPGRMTGCAFPGEPVWLSHDPSPRRKLAWTWELGRSPDGVLILINTQRPNGVVAEAVEQGQIAALRGYGSLRREVRYGSGSRVDLWLDEAEDGGPPCLVEVKSVTLPVGDGVGAFPDSVSARARRHMEALAAEVAAGRRAVVCFLASRADISALRPADEIDPAYGAALRAAVEAGVELVGVRARVGLDRVTAGEALTVRL